MIYFTADTHFNHENVIKYNNRPFDSVRDMNESLVTSWNAIVKNDDVVYHLGDFAFGKKDEITPIFNSLNGKKYLIIGTHDKMGAKMKWVEKNCIREIKIEGQHIVLCHYAMRVWPRSHYGSWQLHGHSHGGLQPLGRQLDVGVDIHQYKPVSIDQVTKEMENKLANVNEMAERQPVL